ncbi:sensor histidine kinase [Paenibacillus sp. PDC88]|uniref:sensor histidine kinase n=1 Tax=Paenibacillus sp. PDC88 TaxID=1884375 RepID=UPI000895F4D9|nr:histidine kinase [Paenibacillus sp. PDC88]SDX44758.1 Sensor histidine kinase YesM [Paenibacillus sp. PDC88]
MIHIKTKLMLFFTVLIVLISALALYLYQNNSNSLTQYDQILKRFFLLNEINQRTVQVSGSIQAFVQSSASDPELLENYERQADELGQLNSTILPEIENDMNYVLVKNYSNMISSFLEQGRQTIDQARGTDLAAYYERMTQTDRTAGFIQDTTLKLINSELSNYQTFYDLMNAKNEHLQNMAVYAFLAAALLCTLFTFWFSEGITNPIRRLSAAARQISRGNLAVSEVKVNSRDELQFLAETFNGMCANIRQLVAEMKQKSELDALVKKMEIRSLQNQINPHFLFNTLNMVSKMAYVEGAEKTSDLVDSISALLRYNLKKMHNDVVLRDEIAIVREYFYIQQMRFGERIRFSETIDESCLSYVVPSLTIQPLIENSFVHGIESYEDGGELSLHIYRQDDLVIVEIRDNGIGMKEEQISKLLRQSVPPDGTTALGHETTEGYSAGREEQRWTENVPSPSSANGIGLTNVLKRLRLYYQREDIMDIESSPGQGTIIRLKLPCTKEEKAAYV